MIMKKFFIALAVLSMSSLLFVGCTPDPVEETDFDLEEEVEVEEEVSLETGDSITSLSTGWNLYKNYDEGYSLEVPKISDIYTCDGMERVPVTVIRVGNISYVTTEYIYKNCQKTYVTSIPQERSTPWKIISRDISDLNALGNFVKEMYGEGCTIETVSSEGFVEINTTGPDGGCFINYISSIRYNEARGKAHSFDIGQDSNFYLSSSDSFEGASYDSDMMESFKFL